jgi:phage shock protein PspC (stress-responsive transcriptional regulator)
MNKTIAVNIGGTVFNIEEKAYELLKAYLEAIEAHFRHQEGSEEIMSDIEARIAELLSEKLGNERDVVTVGDVELVMETMGRPDQYADPDAEYEESSSARSSYRKVYRDPDDKVIAGVASGLSHYFGWDPLILRIAFAVFTLAGFAAIPVYIVLWIVIPEAGSTAEKLRMKGEKVTVDNISKAVNEGLDNMKRTLNSEETKSGLNSVVDAIERFFSFLGKVLSKLVGAGLLAFGLLLTFAFIFGTIALATGTGVNMNVTVSFLQELFFLNESFFAIAVVAAIMLALPPIIGLLYGGVRLLLKYDPPVKGVGLTLVAVFILGTVLGAVVVMKQVSELANDEQVVTDHTLALNGDTLYVKITDDPYWHNNLKLDDTEAVEVMLKDGDRIAFGYPELEFRSSSSSALILEMDREAHGKSNLDAIKYAEAIEYDFKLEGDTLFLAPYFLAPAEHRFRMQDLDLQLNIPEGLQVVLPANIERIADGGDRIDRHRIRTLSLETITQRSGKLACSSCPPEEETQPDNPTQEDNSLRSDSTQTTEPSGATEI